MPPSRAERIAQLNDQCRKGEGMCHMFVTAGIDALSPDDKLAILRKVQNFRDFNKEGDPHGEHDFGAFEHANERIFWKIDYYDKSLTKGSEDPSRPEETTRVLTIMFAYEY